MPIPQITMNAIAGAGPWIEPVAATGSPHSSSPVANQRDSRRLPISSVVATIAASAPTPAAASSTPNPDRPSESRRSDATTASAIHRPRTSERRHA